MRSRFRPRPRRSFLLPSHFFSRRPRLSHTHHATRTKQPTPRVHHTAHPSLLGRPSSSSWRRLLSSPLSTGAGVVHRNCTPMHQGWRGSFLHSVHHRIRIGRPLLHSHPPAHPPPPNRRPSLPPQNGRTAHHYAANAGFELDIVDELLANGADNDAKDDPRVPPCSLPLTRTKLVVSFRHDCSCPSLLPRRLAATRLCVRLQRRPPFTLLAAQFNVTPTASPSQAPGHLNACAVSPRPLHTLHPPLPPSHSRTHHLHPPLIRRQRMTPLHFAADDQRMAVAIRLVEKGADVNATTNVRARLFAAMSQPSSASVTRAYAVPLPSPRALPPKTPCSHHP